MESIYTELALNGSNNECARTDTVFLPISEVCDGTVSLLNASHQYIIFGCNVFLKSFLSCSIIQTFPNACFFGKYVLHVFLQPETLQIRVF